MCVYIYIYIYIYREREREMRAAAPAPQRALAARPTSWPRSREMSQVYKNGNVSGTMDMSIIFDNYSIIIIILMEMSRIVMEMSQVYM